MKFADMTTKELKDMAFDLWDSINVIGCYGTKDLHNLDGAILELENRGYESEVTKTLEIWKSD